MSDEMDPGDALRELLAQRERSKKAVYAAALAREKAEEELAHREKLFQMQIEETQKLASENAGLRSEKEELERRVNLVEDAAAKQALTLAKKDEQLERYTKLIAHVEDAIHEEELSPQEQEIVEKAEEYIAPPVVVADPHEGSHGPLLAPMNTDSALLDAVETAVKSAIKKPLVLVTIVALPFLLMTFFNALMLAGIKVQFVADLITPLWQSWMNDPAFSMVVALVPALLYASLFFRGMSIAPFNPGEAPLPPEPTTETTQVVVTDTDVEEDAYLKQIDEIFGADEDA